MSVIQDKVLHSLLIAAQPDAIDDMQTANSIIAMQSIKVDDSNVSQVIKAG